MLGISFFSLYRTWYAFASFFGSTYDNPVDLVLVNKQVIRDGIPKPIRSTVCLRTGTAGTGVFLCLLFFQRDAVFVAGFFHDYVRTKTQGNTLQM